MTRVCKTIAVVALVAMLALPAAAQLSDVVDDTTGVIDDTTEVIDDTTETLLDPENLPPLLDPASPVLEPVTGTIDDLLAQVEDLLADTPLANILSLQGDDAIDAAIAFSQATFDSSDVAIVARDDVFADALTTGALQGIFDAPLLLTASGDLDPRTARELVRLGVDSLLVLGADDAINPLVVQKLEIAGLDVSRIGGPSRVETAALAAAASAPQATTAVLTRAYPSADGDDSQAYADLLAVSPWAAENGWPVLLTQTSTLTPSVAEALDASDITEIVIIGGEQAVSAATEQAVQALGITTRRVSGPNRFATAVAIAEERGFVSSADTDRLILAEGTSSRPDIWAPGFAGAAHGASHDAPILLTAGDQIPAETLDFILGGLESNLLDGGPATICASFVSPIACEAAGLLLLGHLDAALDLLGLNLDDLPGVDEIIALLEELTGLQVGEVGGTVAEVVEDPVGTVTGDGADDGTATDDGTADTEDPVGDVVEDTTGAVEDVTSDSQDLLDSVSADLGL